jgi:hypothetical protein
MQHMADMKRSNGDLKTLAAIKLPLSDKWVLKRHFLGTVPSGSALFSQRHRRRVEVCKTFMRRFDPDPRLQILQQLRATDKSGFWSVAANKAAN